MRKISLVRLAGATTAVVLGLGACGEGDDSIPEGNPVAAPTTTAQPERFPNDCGMRFPRIETSVRC
jgi:hypothetical protein